MKTDLEKIMEKRGLDALWVTGAAQNNPSMSYFTGLAHITHADLIVQKGKAPALYHFSMEREEALRTGLACHDYATFHLEKLLREAGNDKVGAAAMRIARVFREQGVYGRIAVLGKVEVGPLLSLVDKLRHILPAVELVGEGDQPVLIEARATKSREEISRICAMGRISIEVMADTAEFLTSHAIKKDVLMKKDGMPLTIGVVKERIRRTLAALGGTAPEGFIFSAGRDGAIPHSSGTDSDILRTGVPIVFDFYPQEAGGGYFYDITRTWCIGFAPEEVKLAHEQVLGAYQDAAAAARAGITGQSLQRRVCERFEAQGHPTVWHAPQTESGYVHSLGHGVGLDIHEQPTLSDAEIQHDVLAPGMVFTIEPGLYYPDRNFGVRLEDTFWMDEQGKANVCAPFSMDLVLPIKKQSGKRRIAGKKSVQTKRVPIRSKRTKT
jgi:Xaa-Pro aminopeptidase